MSATRTIHLNAFDMSCAGQQSPGLWRHPDDRSFRFKYLEYWTDLARLLTPGTFADIVKYLVPVLQARGLLRTSCEETTLRENFYGAGQARLRDDHPGAR